VEEETEGKTIKKRDPHFTSDRRKTISLLKIPGLPRCPSDRRNMQRRCAIIVRSADFIQGRRDFDFLLNAKVYNLLEAGNLVNT
jgi:hypothetical protein